MNLSSNIPSKNYTEQKKIKTVFRPEKAEIRKIQGPVCEVGKLAYLRQTQRLVWIEITWPHFISAFQKHYPQPLISAAQSFQQSSRFNRNCLAQLHSGIRALECVNPGIQKFNSHQT